VTKRVFSGVQPTGSLHIGNYLGALKQFVAMQEDNDCIYCIVDLHAITMPKDSLELRGGILDVAALYMAVGIDPKKSIIFVQSDVSFHSELAWILMCNSYMGELSRMTQFKDKSKGNESAPTGLYTYPILMAADILLYDTDVVPVGHDQKQHIELTRDIAIRVNNKYGDDTFIVPEGSFLKEGARIMSLDDPTAKMSKSSENELSGIALLDSEEKIIKAIKRATTDSDGRVRFDVKEKPGISNLMTVYSAFASMSITDVEKKFENQGYGVFKKELAELCVDSLRQIKEKYSEIRPSEELFTTLREGAEKACKIGAPVVERVKNKIGLGTK